MLLHQLRPVAVEVVLDEFEVAAGDGAVAGANRNRPELPLDLLCRVDVEIGLAWLAEESRVASVHALDSYFREARLGEARICRLVKVVPLLHKDLRHFDATLPGSHGFRQVHGADSIESGGRLLHNLETNLPLALKIAA